MMSVQEIQRRRQRKRHPPPGLQRSIKGNDGNNNAEKGKRWKLSKIANTASLLKKMLPKKFQACKEQESNVSKPCRKSRSPSTETIYVSSKPYMDIVGGEEVVINDLGDLEEADKEIEMDENRTPEDYANKYDYFFHINENRKEILHVINRLGEMLVFYDIEGDIDDWASYVDKMERKKKEWKQRCRRSDDYLESTGKVLGVEEKTLKYRLKKFISQKAEQASDYLKSKWSSAKEVCPLLEVACPCVFPSTVERVRSIYSESWHWDEPVPD